MSAFDLQADPSDGDDLPADGDPQSGAVDAAPPIETPPAPEGPGEVVPITPKLSRRAQAQQEMNQRLEGLAKNVEALTGSLSQRDQELGRLRGLMEYQAQQPRYAPPQQQQGLDPDSLMKEAKKALDDKDFDTYHAKTAEAIQLRTLRTLAPVFQELQQRQIPQGTMPPEMIPYFSAHPELARHPQHILLLQAKNTELEARGVPAGPQRLQMVFAEAEAVAKSTRKGNGPQYSQQSAAALSGTPTSRGNGGANPTGTAGVTLTASEMEVAKKLEKQGLMSRADYAKGIAEQDPSRLNR